MINDLIPPKGLFGRDYDALTEYWGEVKRPNPIDIVDSPLTMQTYRVGRYLQNIGSCDSAIQELIVSPENFERHQVVDGVVFNPKGVMLGDTHSSFIGSLVDYEMLIDKNRQTAKIIEGLMFDSKYYPDDPFDLDPENFELLEPKFEIIRDLVCTDFCVTDGMLSPINTHWRPVVRTLMTDPGDKYVYVRSIGWFIETLHKHTIGLERVPDLNSDPKKVEFSAFNGFSFPAQVGVTYLQGVEGKGLGEIYLRAKSVTKLFYNAEEMLQESTAYMAESGTSSVKFRI